jgi:hypothetical protein
VSRSSRSVLAIAGVVAVAMTAACTQRAATIGHPSARASTAHPVAATSATPTAPAATPITSAPPPTTAPAVRPISSAQTSPSGTRYTNARFGFSFDVPTGYQAQSPPVDGDGLSFADPARTATVTAYGAGNVTRYSPAQEMTQLVKTYQGARDTISYRFSQADVIAVSGTTPHGIVFYQREIVYPAVIYTLLWHYPAATAAQYDILVTQTVDSFVPGPDHSG